MRRTLVSLALTPTVGRCSASSDADHCVTGTPTSWGGRHASDTTRAQSVSERERAAAPHAERPPASAMGHLATETAGASAPVVRSCTCSSPRDAIGGHPVGHHQQRPPSQVDPLFQFPCHDAASPRLADVAPPVSLRSVSSADRTACAPSSILQLMTPACQQRPDMESFRCSTPERLARTQLEPSDMEPPQPRWNLGRPELVMLASPPRCSCTAWPVGGRFELGLL